MNLWFHFFLERKKAEIPAVPVDVPAESTARKTRRKK